MAWDSFNAGEVLQSEGLVRSAASRYYYAAYQAATALLVYRGLTLPQDREAWSHEQTPELVLDELAPVLRERDRRFGIHKRLRTLYRLRVAADYRTTRPVDDEDATAARREAGYILSVADDVLPVPRGVS